MWRKRSFRFFGTTFKKYIVTWNYAHIPWLHFTHLWPFTKRKFNLKSDRVNLVAQASPIECLLHIPNVRAIQYKLGPERLTQFGNSNVLRLPVIFSFLTYVQASFLQNIWTQFLPEIILPHLKNKHLHILLHHSFQHWVSCK